MIFFQRRRHDVGILGRPGVTWLAAALGTDRDGLLRAAGALQARQLCGRLWNVEMVKQAEEPFGRLRDDTGDPTQSNLLTCAADRFVRVHVVLASILSLSLRTQWSPSKPWQFTLPSAAPSPSTSRSTYLPQRLRLSHSLASTPPPIWR